jgi:hypothetical protein
MADIDGGDASVSTMVEHIEERQQEGLHPVESGEPKMSMKSASARPYFC